MKVKKVAYRILTLLLAACMLIQMAPPIQVDAAGTEVVTAATAAELPDKVPAGMTVELTADIILEPEQQISLLAGTLDGMGHTITTAGKALAAEVTGTIQNLGVASTSAVSGSMFGPSFGAVAIRLTGGTILNSFCVADIADNYNDCGSLVGISVGGTIRNSFHGGTISGMMFGGLIGTSSDSANPSTITECYYTSGDSPVSMGSHYNKAEARFAKKTQEQMKAPEFVKLLNTNIQPTGYKWEAVPGAMPKLVPDDGGSVDPDQPKLDTSYLKATIEEALALKPEEYTPESWTALQEALSKAQQVLGKENLTQQEVDAAAALLRTAIDNLKKPLLTEAVPLPAEGVIEIKSQAQLSVMTVASTKGKFYRLANDIVIDDPYWYGNSFGGVLDGNGHTITMGKAPLFETLAEESVIQNVGFLGTVKSSDNAGGVAIEGSGLIVNCWNRADVSTEGQNGNKKDTGAFVAHLNDGGVIINCYAAGKVFSKGSKGTGMAGALAGTSSQNTLIKNCFWLNTTAASAVGKAEGTVESSVSQKRGGFYSKENLDKLNANRGTYGKEWTIDNDGWFHLGAAGNFNPQIGSSLVFTYDPIYNKEPVTFDSGEGLELSIGDFLVPAEDSREMPQYVGCFSNPNFDGPIACVPEYVSTGQGNHKVMVSREGKLNIQDSGSLVVHIYDKNSWSGTVYEKELTSFTIVVTPIIAEQIRLVPHGKYVDSANNTVSGSGNVTVEGQVKVNGQWKKAAATMFSFATEGEIFGEGDGFYATAPGKITVTANGFEKEAILKMESTYVPVTSIKPFPQGLHYLHARNANSEKKGDFLDLTLADGAGRCDIQPENASYRGDTSWRMESSDPKIAEYIPDFLLAVLPYKAGKVTLTATSLDPNLETPASGSTELELRYLNPVTAVSLNLEELDQANYNPENRHMLLNGEEAISLPIHFTGSKSPEMAVDPRDGVEKEFSWHVSEPDMIWIQEGNGEVEIVRDGDLGMFVKTPLEYVVANDQFKITGVVNGTVTVTGVPADKTNKIEPVSFTVEVTGVQEPDPYDVPGFLASAKGSAVTGVKAGLSYQCGSDEWQILSLLRAGETLPEGQLDAYYNRVAETIKTWPDTRKPTDFERVALTLSAMGKDITNVDGINLAEKIYNNKKLVVGSNEVAFALLALDAGSTPIPETAKFSRSDMVELLLSFQNEDGGFGLAPGSSSGADTSAMALQALAPYQDQAKVAAAIENGLVYLKNDVHTKAGHFDQGTVESNAQTIIAMAVLGRNVLTEPGFYSARYNLMRAMESYHVPGEGFKHTAIDPKVNAMATAQALQALDAYQRFLNGESGYWCFDNSTIPPINPDGHAVASVLDAIHKIPDAADVTERNCAAIMAAREAFEALSPSQQALVNTKRLAAAEEALENLEKPNPDKEAANKVISLIDALPDEIQLKDKAAVETARAAYEKLSQEQKKLVTNYKKLTAAENKLSILENEENQNRVYISVERFTIGQGFVAEPLAVDFSQGETYADIIKKVLGRRASIRDNGNYLEMIIGADLGPNHVKIPEYLEKLSDGKISTPIAIDWYENWGGKDTWGEGNLGEFTYSGSAGWMYHVNGIALNTGIGETLAEAGAVVRVQYTVFGLGQDLTDPSVSNKDNLIRAMANVNGEPEAIRSNPALKEAYEAAAAAAEEMTLPEEQVYTACANLLDALADAKGTPQDRKASEKVMELIDAIGTVTVESAEKIKTAREAYNKLTDLQKQLVFNYDTLLAAEKKLAQLQVTEEDKKAAARAETLIDDIGEVTVNSAKKISEAREAYDRLTDLQKQLVSNYNKLVNAEKKLAQLKAPAHREIYDAAGKNLEMMVQKNIPQVGSVGGEWVIIGLARSGKEVPTGYYENVVGYVSEHINDKQQLHRAKSSDNSRVILALTSIGRDVTDVAGHNLLMGLTDMKYLVKQGINGPIWALIALDSHDYEIPQNKAAEDQTTRQKLLDYILEAQLPDGGWDLANRDGDADMTGMAIQALAPYCDQDERVREAIDKALILLSNIQHDDGTFGSVDGSSSESSAQVVVALSCLGINADTDPRFMKNGISALDGLGSFAVEGGFSHFPGGKLDQMATEQGYYAFTAYYRMLEGKTSLYDMTDVTVSQGNPQIPVKPENPDNPQTGDEQPLMLTAAVMMLSVLALGAVLYYRKKQICK